MMFELLEVEIVCCGFLFVMEGEIIMWIMVNWLDFRWLFFENMVDCLMGKCIIVFCWCSKYIMVDFDSGESLFIYFGMFGCMMILGYMVGEFYYLYFVLEKYDYVVFDMENGVWIMFNDVCWFGVMDLMVIMIVGVYWLLKDIGFEFLGNDFNEVYLLDWLKGCKMLIKIVLFD